MPMTPFHALYTARELSTYTRNADRLVAAYASSNIEVYPYQIAAAMFALRSPFLKGVVLADEGSLGKTYEALLVITQMWFEGKERILIIVPTPLLCLWTEILDHNFNVPFENAEFRMQNSIMDLYWLISFIDENALPDADSFDKRYFRKPENYGELTATASRYCSRTLRSHVERYVMIPRRIPVTADYGPTAAETKLVAMLDDYWKKLTKWFFAGKHGYSIDEETKTLRVGVQSQKVFTGAALRRREYSLADKTLSPASSIAKNIIGEIFGAGFLTPDASRSNHLSTPAKSDTTA